MLRLLRCEMDGSNGPSVLHFRTGYCILTRMQLGLPFENDSTPAAPLAPADISYVRHRRARRYLLRINADGSVRVTIPRGGSRREAHAFAQKHRDWIERHRATLTFPRLPGDERR